MTIISNINHLSENQRTNERSVISSMFVLLFFLLAAVVHGQLSISELFQFHSKYASSGNCSDFHYAFKNVHGNFLIFNGLRIDCNSSSLILESQSISDSSTLCIKDIEYQQNFRVHFHSIQSIGNEMKIETNQIQLYGIELATLDDFIHEIYSDLAYYRSQWALLINLGQNNHFALALNDEMMFLVFLNPTYNDLEPSMISQIDLIFPNHNIFSFNRSQLNVWRVDEGFVRNPTISKTSTDYQLSKSSFQLYSNETFFIYGTQELLPRRFQVLIDEIPASCNLNYIFRCNFPLLPSTINDTHQPKLRVIYSRRSILNATLTLRPRKRLSHIPTTFSLMNISAFQVTLDESLCE